MDVFFSMYINLFLNSEIGIMRKKNLIITLSSSIFIIILTAIYASISFNKNIFLLENTLKKTSHITIDSCTINAYKLQAHFKKVVFKTIIDGIGFTYHFGDSIELVYNIFTKTLTMRVLGDEACTIKSSNYAFETQTFSKKDGQNNTEFSVRFKDFIPVLSSENMETSEIIRHIVKLTQAIRIKSIQTKIEHINDGTFSADMLKFTAEPHIETNKKGEMTLHIYDKYTLKGIKYESQKPINMSLLPIETTGHSHIIIQLGDKTKTTTHRLIDEFARTHNFTNFFEALSIETKSESKQTYSNMISNSLSTTTYSGAKKLITFHSDSKDMYHKTWKNEFLPFLQLLSSAEHLEDDQGPQHKISDEILLDIFPKIENNNPIHKIIDLNISLDEENINTKIAIGYDIAAHGAHLEIIFPLSKNTLLSTCIKGLTTTHVDLLGLFNGKITASLTLKNSKQILDDVQGILERSQKIFHDAHIFGDLATNRQLANILLTTFSEKKDRDHLKIQISYDPILNKFNLDSANGSVNDIMTKLLPSFLKEQAEHKHGHSHTHNHMHDKQENMDSESNDEDIYGDEED